MSRELDDAVTFEDEDGEANTLSAEFATSTMGHVLLGQGRADAAREVFRAVLSKDPADAEALRGLALLGVTAVAPTTAVAHAVDATTAYARWSIGGARPREGASLVLVVVSLWIDGRALRRDEREYAVESLEGERFVAGLRPGAAHHLAVGWRSADGFRPLATMGPVHTPGAAPSSRVATDLATVGRAPTQTVFEEVLDAWQRAAMPSS